MFAKLKAMEQGKKQETYKKIAEAVKFSSPPSLCTNKFFHVLVKPQHRLWRGVQDLAPAPFSFSSAKSTSWTPKEHQKLPVLSPEICCWK